MRILYLIKQPLVPRDFDRFGVAFFLSHGHSVTVLDLSDYLHPDLANDRRNEVSHPGMEIRYVNRSADLRAEQHTFAAHDLVVFLAQSFGLSRAMYLPLRLLAKAGTPYLIQIAPIYPGWNLKGTRQGLGGTLRDVSARVARMNPVNSLIAHIPPRLLGLPFARYALYPSRGTLRRNSLVGPATRAIEAHVHDYDIYLRQKAETPQDKPQAVFLDQFAPFHHDFQSLKARPVEPEPYYQGLCRLFARIEDELGLDVIVAAHPRADYSAMPDAFGGRPVIYGETARLVCESQLIIAHNSVSTAFAVMDRKAILLVVNHEMYHRHPYQKHFYDALAAELGSPLRFIDDPDAVDLSGCLEVDQARYDAYLENYSRCPGAADKPCWEIVYDVLAGDGFVTESTGPTDANERSAA